MIAGLLVQIPEIPSSQDAFMSHPVPTTLPASVPFQGPLHGTLPGTPPCDPTLWGSQGQGAQKGFPATCKQMLLLVLTLRSDQLTAGERGLTLRGLHG